MSAVGFLSGTDVGLSALTADIALESVRILELQLLALLGPLLLLALLLTGVELDICATRAEAVGARGNLADPNNLLTTSGCPVSDVDTIDDDDVLVRVDDRIRDDLPSPTEFRELALLAVRCVTVPTALAAAVQVEIEELRLLEGLGVTAPNVLALLVSTVR